MNAISLRRIGLVLHPVRDVSEPLTHLRRWAGTRGTELVELIAPGMVPRLEVSGAPGDCDLVLALGGDGTMLAAIRLAMAASRPVLGIACGSLGVLARVTPAQAERALDRITAGEWHPQPIPGLVVRRPGEPELLALNDLSVLRAGIGQIRVTTWIDDALWARVAGDGMIASTPIGSGAYSLAAGGPLLTAGLDGYLLTPLSTHGGAVPPLVVGPGAHARLEVAGGFGGARLELDGQLVPGAPAQLDLLLTPGVADLVAFADQPPTFAVLRDRGVVADSPRVLADRRRASEGQS